MVYPYPTIYIYIYVHILPIYFYVRKKINKKENLSSLLLSIFFHFLWFRLRNPYSSPSIPFWDEIWGGRGRGRGGGGFRWRLWVRKPHSSLDFGFLFLASLALSVINASEFWLPSAGNLMFVFLDCFDFRCWMSGYHALMICAQAVWIISGIGWIPFDKLVQFFPGVE